MVTEARSTVGYLSYIRHVLRPHKRRLVIAVIALLGVTLVGLVSPLMLALIIDNVVGQGRYDLLFPIILVLLSLPIINGIFQAISDYTVTLLGQRLVFDIRMDLYDRVHRLSCKYMQNATTGKLMERLRGDVQQVQNLMTNQTLSLAVQLVSALLSLGLMAYLSIPITSLVIVAALLYVLNYKFFIKRIRRVQKRYRYKMDHLSSRAQERLSGSIVVKIFGHERQESRAFIRRNFVAERIYHRYRMLNLGYGLAASGIAWGCYLAVLLLGTRSAVLGTLTYGAVTALAAYMWRLLQPAIQLADLSNQIQQAKVSMDRIFELMRAEPDAIHRPGKRLPKLAGEVAFHNLCFQYEPGKPVLKHINLYVQPGQTIALVGHTGCGKSTIGNLLYRYYEPQAGHLEIDGHDISTLDTRWYRRHLALVPQDPIVFDTTIYHNIAYGRADATRPEIEQAARAAELGPLLDNLPQGLDTPLGEYGITLSVGERQRMCLARAIIADPAILILDEATSSLDTQSETAIQLAMKRLMANRTCFVIAHRLSTIVNADQIVVMDGGRVMELGTHHQLMAKTDSYYRHLFLTQSAPGPKMGVAS
ncbi:MAG: ABC transporter ATP-binding protein [Phycisphaerales bacterium]|jgi:ABC-type multidrug transport system fused ATPase/permease subunit|nr:ABC transporter ATP-binding protein [Phycisphaerales bacterium]